MRVSIAKGIPPTLCAAALLALAGSGLLQGGEERRRKVEAAPPLQDAPPLPPGATPAGEPKEEAALQNAIRIFQLRYMTADASCREALSVLGPLGTISMDTRTNSLVVRASPERMKLIEEVIAALDRPGAEVRLPKEARRLRLVWLLQTKELSARPIPPDLKAVAEELQKVGVEDLSMVAQVIVLTTTDGKFSLTSRPQVVAQGDPCRLEVTGQVGGREEAPEVQVQVRAIQGGAGSPESTLCSLSSTISAPPAHPVVLCVSPIGASTSVFVVQVMGPAGR